MSEGPKKVDGSAPLLASGVEEPEIPASPPVGGAVTDTFAPGGPVAVNVLGDPTAAHAARFAADASSYTSSLSQLDTLTQRNQRLLERYREKITPDLLPLLEKLNRRQVQNREAIRELKTYPDEAYRQDLHDRTLILQGRILDLGRQLGMAMELTPPSAEAIDRMMRRLQEAEPSPRDSPLPLYPALINHPYPGIDILLRDYQIEALRAFEADLGRLKHLGGDPEDFEGTVVMPTGSGKTRWMSAAMAVRLARGEFEEGDKFIVTTHLKTLTAQNLGEIKEQLAADFRRKFGRELRVTAVAGNEENYSGDVVVVSIPKVGRRDHDFRGKLEEALGPDHHVVMAVMDEIHHKESAVTWQGVEQDIRAVSSDAYILGLTATPRGSEKNLICKKGALELIRAGVLPNVHLIEVPTNRHLDGIKTAGGDFIGEELAYAINNPVRNHQILQALEKYGVRSEKNKNALAPTLIRTASIRHAFDVAKTYAEYFGRDDLGFFSLRGRKVLVMGLKEEGKGFKSFTAQEMKDALAAKARGEVDAVVCVVTGMMQDREIVFENWKNGNIEAVVYADVFRESLDAWYVQNLVGGSATLSAENKAQEAGRITRRGRDEYDDQTGQIIKERPRVAIDMRDIYTKGHLYSYRESFGYWHRTIPPETPWDIMADGPVNEPLTEAPPVAPLPKREKSDDEKITPPSVVLRNLMEIFATKLAADYSGDLGDMAFDLGIDPSELALFLSPDHPKEPDLSLMQRLATLLYEPRDAYTAAYLNELTMDPTNARYAVLETLKFAVQRYRVAEKIPEGVSFAVKVDTGLAVIEEEISRYTIEKLFENQFVRSYRKVARGLHHYFSEKDPRLAAQIITAMNKAYGGRLGWDRRVAAVMPWTAENIFSEQPDMLAALREGRTVYLQSVRQWFVYPNGLWSSSVQFSLEPPSLKNDGLSGHIGFSLNNGRLVIRSFGGKGGRAMARGILKVVPNSWAASLAMAECGTLDELTGLFKQKPNLLIEIVEEVYGGIDPEKPYYVVGNAYSVIRPGGFLDGYFSVSDEKPKPGRPFVEFYINSGTMIFGSYEGSQGLLLQKVLAGAPNPMQYARTQPRPPKSPGPIGYRPERDIRMAGALTWSDALTMGRGFASPKEAKSHRPGRRNVWSPLSSLLSKKFPRLSQLGRGNQQNRLR